MVRKPAMRVKRGDPTMDFARRGIIGRGDPREPRLRLDAHFAVHIAEVTEMLQIPNVSPARRRLNCRSLIAPMDWRKEQSICPPNLTPASSPCPTAATWNMRRCLVVDSADRLLAGMSQRLFVPTHDLPLFAPMAHGTRTLGSQDRDLLPRWLWKLPMPSPPLRALLRLPRRNIYLSPFSRPVRGWIAQQIMKIAACAESPTEIIMHVDSDGEFIRPFTANAVLRSDGLARFYRNPEKSNYQTHIAWRETACRLLGVEPDSASPGITSTCASSGAAPSCAA